MGTGALLGSIKRGQGCPQPGGCGKRGSDPWQGPRGDRDQRHCVSPIPIHCLCAGRRHGHTHRHRERFQAASGKSDLILPFRV